MSRTLYLLAFLCLTGGVQGQVLDSDRLIIGLETGFNNNVGTGLTFDYRFQEYLALHTGAGIGLWGMRAYLGLRHYWSYADGFHLNIGIAGHSGFAELPLGDNNEVTLKQEPQATFQASAAYTLKLPSKSLLTLGAGYSFKFQHDINMRAREGFTIQNSHRKTAEFLHPGGFSFSVGLSIPAQQI